MADTQTITNDSSLSDSLGFDINKLPPAFRQEAAAKERAAESKIDYETSKQKAQAEGKVNALNKFSEESKAHHAEVEKQMLPEIKFKPTQDNAADIGGLFSMIATMGVALGGSGKLSGLNAMNAMGGMLKGYQQGRKDLFTKEQATFDKELASIKAHNDLLIKKLAEYDALRVTDKEAALIKGGEIDALFPGLIAKNRQAAKDDVNANIAQANREMIVKMAEARTKLGLAGNGQGAGLKDYFPEVSFSGTKSQNEDKKNSINAGALSLATADDLKQYAKQHPEYLGRQGEIAQNVDRYYKSWLDSNGTVPIESMPDDGQPALIFAKKYAAYLVGYERTLAGSNRGMTQQFQARFNKLMDQNQFNAAGFEALMNEQMQEVANATASKDPAITGPKLFAYGKDIAGRGKLDFNAPQAQPEQKTEVDEQGKKFHWEYSPDGKSRRKVYE